MSDWTHLLAILPGIFAGLLLISRVSHVAQIFTKTEVDPEDTPPTDQLLSQNQILIVAAAVIWGLDLFGPDNKAIAGLIFLAGPVGSFIVYRVQRRVMFSDLGYASHMGKTSVYTLSADGLEVEGPRPCHAAIWPDLIIWPNILRAARFSDGMLLCGCGRVTDSFALAWLPDAALRDAQPDEVLRFIEAKIQPRTIKRLKRLTRPR